MVVPVRILSLGELLENQRKTNKEQAKLSRTRTYSIRVGDLHYTLHQRAA